MHEMLYKINRQGLSAFAPFGVFDFFSFFFFFEGSTEGKRIPHLSYSSVDWPRGRYKVTVFSSATKTNQENFSHTLPGNPSNYPS
jgi:hypothetical protein